MESIDRLARPRRSWRYLALAILIPTLYCLVLRAGLACGPWPVRWELSREGAPFPADRDGPKSGAALGEEIGWRGFLAPTLYRTRGFLWAGIGTGLIWALWHVPLTEASATGVRSSDQAT
jgi:hypothetical protein